MEWVCGASGGALLVIVIATGYLGSGTALDNFAPTFIPITFWVALVLVTAALGYTLLTLAAQVVWGVETWTRCGETSAVY